MNTIIIVLTVRPEKWEQTEKEVCAGLAASFGNRDAPWIPGHALQHVTSARVNGRTAFDRGES